METGEEGVASTETNGQAQKRFKFTVEIPIFLTIFGVSLSGAPINNLIMYRTCVHSLHKPKELCQTFLAPGKFNHSQELENEVQEYATLVTTVKSVLEALGPAILSLFISAWSDKHGRKPLVVWGLLGITLTSMMVVIYSMMDESGPWWIILTVAPVSLSGGFLIMFTGAMCYVYDVSTTETRSIRLLFIQIAFAMGNASGTWLSPYVLRLVGIVYLLLIVAALCSFSYTFTNVFLEESLRSSTPGNILTVLNFGHVKEMFQVCFKRRPSYRRAAIILMTSATCLIMLTGYGIIGLAYLYTRNKLHWTMKDYTTFSAVSVIMWFSGSFFAIAVIQKYLHISDLAFVNIGIWCCLAEYAIKAGATNTWHMYLGSAASLFGAVPGPLMRSFLTKILPASDIAKVFGLLGCAEAILPLVAPVMYNSMYEYTLAQFPGAFYMFSCIAMVVCIVFVGTVQYLMWKTCNTAYEIMEEP